MVELLFLLLPLAFYSGWRAARKSFDKNEQKNKQLSDHFVKGVNFLLNEEPDKALEVFLNYPDIDEYTAETYHLLGNMFRNRGEVDRALRVHQNLIGRSNLNPEQKQKAMFSLGKDFFAAGMLDRAESVFTELLNNTHLSKQISRESICTSLRTIYEQTQEWDKAIEASRCYAKASKHPASKDNTKTNSLITHYYCELADEALTRGKLHEVAELLDKAKSTDKSATRILCLEGDVAYHQKHYQKAFKHYLSAINRDSRLLNMLADKLEYSARETGAIPRLQKNLIKQYNKVKDKTLLEAILDNSRKYSELEPIDGLIESELSGTKLNIESIYKATNYINTQTTTIDKETGLLLVGKSLSNYLQGIPAFRCEHCGYKMHDYLWRCPACHHWDTIDHA